MIKCEWSAPLEPNKMITKSLAAPLMIDKILSNWTDKSRAETWEDMRYYLLGSPHGKRSSLFVSQDTALAMKKIHNAMNESGMFGVLRQS